jgi:hypothetical protein
VITRTGDEMPVALPVDADQTFRHGLILYSHPLRLTESREKALARFSRKGLGHPIIAARDR